MTRDRAEQRSGRAGRVSAGVAYRLWSEADEQSRPAKALPEILDADLAPLVLACASSGSRIRIDYDGAEPTAEVRLQECFGMKAAPVVGEGRIPVVMTLLSPAMRPCAVTKDLAGFWREGYQLVKKDLKGRYPKHYWPDDPLTAVATRRVRPVSS